MKLIVIMAILAASAAGAFYYYRESSAPKPPEFATAKVSRGDVVQTITATGQLDPLLTVDVSSQISGLVKELFVDFNTPVKAGQKLAEIDPATYLQRLRQAEADLASAEASNTLARLNAARTKELFEKKLVTQQEYDQSVAQLAQSAAQLLTRQAAVENVKVDLSRCTIYSPIDGVVISKQTEVGKTVAASLNAPTLFIIANDLAKMQILAAVAEADIGAVKEGQPVTFTVDAFPTRNFRGTVTQVRNSPKNQNNVVTYETIIDVDNRDLNLRPGMTANVSIEVAKREAVLKIGNAALRVRMPDTVSVVSKDAPAATATPAGGPAPAGAPAAAVRTAATPPAPTSGASSSDRGTGERRERGPGGGGRRGGMFGGADLTDEQRAKVREIMAEVGVDFRSGPPSQEQRDKIRQLMVAAGIPVSDSGGRSDASQVVTRTVYRLPGGDKTANPEALTVRVGISDGFSSEILSGLEEGDTIITSVTIPGAVVTPNQSQQNNPFAGSRGPGGMGGGRGGRGF